MSGLKSAAVCAAKIAYNFSPQLGVNVYLGAKTLVPKLIKMVPWAVPMGVIGGWVAFPALTDNFKSSIFGSK